MTFTKIDIPDIKIRTAPDIDLREFEQKIYDNALNNVVTSLKELEPNAPEEVYYAFVKLYFAFDISHDYDVRTRTYSIVCTPIWKSPSQINKNSKEFRIIKSYMNDFYREV